jgi:glycosyltransferase involved in cell wall biosynthesis
MSNALMEAMASGLPCVVADIPGNGFLVTPEETGLVFDPSDSRMLAKTVLRLFETPGLAQQLGQLAKQKIIEHYSLSRVTELYLQLYLYLLGQETIIRPAEFQPVVQP